MPSGKAPGAQFEILVDGKPRSYRATTRPFAIEAAEHLNRKHPNSEDLASGQAYKSESGATLSASTARIHSTKR